MKYRKKTSNNELITGEILHSVLPQYQPISKKINDYKEARLDSRLYKAITKDNKIGIFHNPAYKRVLLIKVYDPLPDDPFNMKTIKTLMEEDFTPLLLDNEKYLFVQKHQPVKVYTLQEALEDSGIDEPASRSNYIL